MSIIKITSDLGFGDCGKGTIVSSLCNKYKTDADTLVVRYNGGAQACHAVKKGPIQHQFHMFGSGTLEGAKTLLANQVLVDPIVVFEESRELEQKLGTNVCSLLHIDPECLVTTTYHKLVNQAKESARGNNRHGSCGMGIGATVEYNEFTPDAIRVKDLLPGNTKTLEEKLALQIRWAIDIIEQIEPRNSKVLETLYDPEEFEAQLDIFPKIIQRHQIIDSRLLLSHLHSKGSPLIFEASQGILLDQDWGFHPHTTWSRTTADNAFDLLMDANISGEMEVIGIMRAYQTRHGAGPFPTETTELKLQDKNNPTNPWQGDFRIGYLDLKLTSYAIHANTGIDSLAITCFDQVKDQDLKVCVAYDKNLDLKHENEGDLHFMEQLGKELMTAKPSYLPMVGNQDYLNFISEFLETPISILSEGPDTADKRFSVYDAV